jgi:hypothetical protein
MGSLLIKSIRSFLNEYWILFAFMVLQDFERKKKNDEFISLLCVWYFGIAQFNFTRFLIICVASQNSRKKKKTQQQKQQPDDSAADGWIEIEQDSCTISKAKRITG